MGHFQSRYYGAPVVALSDWISCVDSLQLYFCILVLFRLLAFRCDCTYVIGCATDFVKESGNELFHGSDLRTLHLTPRRHRRRFAVPYRLYIRGAAYRVCLWSPHVIGQTTIFFALWFLSFFFLFFPRLISAVGDWMSTILPHIVWP